MYTDKEKEYHREYYLKNKDRIKEQKKQQAHKYYLENKQKILDYSHKYYSENKEHIKERTSKWSKNNSDKVRKAQRENYIKNREHIRKRKNDYRHKHREEINAKSREKYSQKTSNKQEYGREYRRKNREHRKDIALKYSFGISLEEYNKIFDRQEGKCAICGIPRNETNKDFAVDHNHETGEIRGLLCLYCNRMLGDAKDKVETLRKGIEYLEKLKDV
jgi:hypothetical protein